MAIKFNKHHVTDGTNKARIHYSLDNRIDGQRCVTLYAKDYGHQLGKVIREGYQNDTDVMTDYFDKGRVVLFESSPFYSQARASAEQAQRDREARWQKHRERMGL